MGWYRLAVRGRCGWEKVRSPIDGDLFQVRAGQVWPPPRGRICFHPIAQANAVMEKQPTGAKHILLLLYPPHLAQSQSSASSSQNIPPFAFEAWRCRFPSLAKSHVHRHPGIVSGASHSLSTISTLPWLEPLLSFRSPQCRLLPFRAFILRAPYR